MVDRPHATAAQRNAAPILEALSFEMRGSSRVLEIGSGTGQHAVRFAADLGHLQWQPSELRQNLPGIRRWIAHTGTRNVDNPIELDVLTSNPPAERYDAVFSANTAHIMSYDAVVRMLELCGAVLETAGVFCLYGPFSLGGEHTTDSNAAFDTSLRARDPRMGVRDLDDLAKLAADNGMVLKRVYAMPANNFLLVWNKPAHEEQA